MMRTRYARDEYPFHHAQPSNAARVAAALARHDARMKEQARRERNARMAVYLIFTGIGLAIAARLAYWTDITAIFSGII